jgi:hypothetical protein
LASRNQSNRRFHLSFAFLFVLLSGSLRAQSSVYFMDFVSETFQVVTPVSASVTAAWSQFISKPAGFGPGFSGYAHHYVVSLGDNVNGKLIRDVGAPLISRRRYEPYYFSGGGKSVWYRLGRASLHSVFADPDSEKSLQNFNWSGIPASLTSAALSNAYQPTEQRTVAATFQRFGTNALGYAAGDLASELLCDVEFVRHFVSCRRRERWEQRRIRASTPSYQ